MIRRYLEYRRLGLGLSHLGAEILAATPPTIYLAACDVVGTLEWLLHPKRRQRARRLLHGLFAAVGHPQKRVRTLPYFRSWWRLNWAQAYIPLSKIENVEKLVRVSGLEHIEEALESKKGVIVASLHSLWGHLAAAYLIRKKGWQFTSLRKRQRASLLASRAQGMVFYGAQPVFLEEGEPLGGVLKTAVQVLSRNEGLFVYLDGIYGERQTTVNILGSVVNLREGLLGAARFVGTPVSLASVRTTPAGIEIVFSPLYPANSESEKAHIFEELARLYESYVPNSPHSLPLGKFEKKLVAKKNA
jgi:lauroyl/myristoyl acyltransferase